MTATYDRPEVVRPAVALTPNARFILEKRYLLPGETPEDRFWAVAQHVAQCEEQWGEDPAYWSERFYARLAALEFLPNSPTLFNAGTPHGGTLSGCFVVPIEDSMESILAAHAQAAWIMKYGGGIGFDFSQLRPRGSGIKTTHQGACGPVAVMAMMSQLSDTFTQGAGAKRVGAQMHILRVDHPNIEAFIACKNDGSSITHANISVAVTDAFMEALAGNGSDPEHPYHYELAHAGRHYGWRDARKVWHQIAESAWRTGDPGLWFIDRANGEANPLAHYTRIDATNPCGEQSLEPYGSCNLGSIDVSKFVCPGAPESEEFDWFSLSTCVQDAVRFLDDVVEMNELPTDETAEANRKSRRIGLGIMGWADALVALQIPYDSERAVKLGARLMSLFQWYANQASLRLGHERGPYGAWTGSSHQADGLRYRNSFRTTIAPTGSISMIAGCSSGIEPHFALAWDRKTEIGMVHEEHPAYAAWKASGAEELPVWLRTAHDIAPEWHIRHQAAFQAYVDNAISKTINMPHDATTEQIMAAYAQAYAAGCKGITVYRDGCRDMQVLTVTADDGCPECKGPVDHEEGCMTCASCGWSACSV